MSLSPLVVLIDLRIDAVLWQNTFQMRSEIRLYSTSHGSDDLDIKWCKLDTQSIRVSVQGGLGGVVYAAENIGNNACKTANHDNGSFGFDKQGSKQLCNADDGEEVGVEALSGFSDVDVQCRDSERNTGVVDKIIQTAACR